MVDMTLTLTAEDLEEVPCNLCGSGDHAVWATRDGFRIVRCVRCGLVFVNPRMNPAALARAYGPEYLAMHSEQGALAKRLRMYEIEVRELESLVPGGRILDVGCGAGAFLSKLGPQWEAYGTDLNAVAAERAREEFGIQVRVGRLTELGYPAGFFDVVNLRGVLEHFEDPFAYLAESFRILKPGGLAAINTPNIDSLCAWVYREKFRLVDPRFHITYFSTRTLRRILERAGLRVERTRYFYLGTPYADWKDAIRIAIDGVRLAWDRACPVVSPAFFDNVVHMYARK